MYGQTTDSLEKKPNSVAADDPSQFFTRVELFNELQHYPDFDLNQSILRINIKIGKSFTTRLDLPYVHNSHAAPADYKHSGLGDISFRLLGYKLRDKPKSAVTASIEISLNTAESPLLGTGKNLVIPVVTFSRVIPKYKMITSLLFQQVNSFSGDETRKKISFSKIQLIFIRSWTKKFWTTLAPEWYIDYINEGLSMNLRLRAVYAPVPRIDLFTTASAGIFGDFVGRYQWSAEVGCRYFLFKRSMFKSTNKD